MRRCVALFLTLVVLGCGEPMAPEIVEVPCEEVPTCTPEMEAVSVLRFAGQYVTNKLEIMLKSEYECELTSSWEEGLTTPDGILWIFTRENYLCTRCLPNL